MYVITSNHVYTTMAVQDWQPVIDQLQKTLKKIKAPLNEDETDGGMNAVAALVQANGKACLTIGMGATHSQIKDILDSLDIFASSPDYTQTEVNFTASTQMQTVNTYTYNINVGFLLPIVWEHLQGLEAELKKKTGTPPTGDAPLEKWAVYKQEPDTLVITQDPPKDQDYLQGYISLNMLCIDEQGCLQLATSPLTSGDIKGLAIFGYTP